MKIKGLVNIVLALCVASCGSNQRPGIDYSTYNPEPDTCSPLIVNVGLEAATRATDVLTMVNLTDFDVSAIWNYNALPENKWYMKQQKVTKPSTEWVTTPMSYWTVTGNLSFFMYAPSASTVDGITPIYSSTGMPGISYTPNPDNISDMPDLCMARPVLNSTKEIGSVPAVFHHTLTQIWFDMNYEGTPPSGYSVKVENIKLRNIVGTRTATYTTVPPYFEWSGGSADTDYELKLSSSHLRDMYLALKPAPEEPIQNSMGRLYLIPQTLDPSACIEITYSFFDTAPDPDVRKATFTKSVNIPSPSVWPANRTIRYKITVDVGLSSPVALTGCTIDDWTESGSIHTEIEFD
ncbi:MAG: hypothetical protein IKW84_01915 [Bacteroidaceae bacterium]|nr:hypothetical protein [Bacteroidaceae bacterium]